MIQPGEPAPDFTLPDQDGNEVSLAELRGGTVVLAFYPLDFSPACTDQLKLYQGVLSELDAQDAHLYGVSVDSAFCHKAFREHLNLTMPLLADFNPKGEVARRYGAYIDQRGHSERALVMIGPEGTVTWTHVSQSPLEVPGANLMLDALAAQPHGAPSPSGAAGETPPRAEHSDERGIA